MKRLERPYGGETADLFMRRVYTLFKQGTRKKKVRTWHSFGLCAADMQTAVLYAFHLKQDWEC